MCKVKVSSVQDYIKKGTMYEENEQDIEIT